MSEDTKVAPASNLWRAMFAVQGELQGIVKKSENDYFDSKYVDRTAILEAIKPLFQKNGLLLIQTPTLPPFPPTFNDKGDESAVLAFKTIIVHVESGEAWHDTAVVPLTKADPQGFGSAVTYTSRYMLTMVLGLPLLDDDGNAASGKPGNGPAVRKQPTTSQKTSPAVGATNTTTGAPKTAAPSKTPDILVGSNRKLWGAS